MPMPQGRRTTSRSRAAARVGRLPSAGDGPPRPIPVGTHRSTAVRRGTRFGERFAMSDPYTDLGLVIASSDSVIEGSDGRDLLTAVGGDATLRGGWGDDTLVGGNGDDSLEGGRIALLNHPDSNLLSGGG